MLSNITKGYATAIQGGSVMGLSFVAMGLLMLQLLLLAFSRFGNFESQEALYVAIADYGLGGSSTVFSIMTVAESTQRRRMWALTFSVGLSRSDYMPPMLAGSCLCLFFVAMAMLSRCNQMKQKLNSLTLYMIAGQLVIVIQIMGSINELVRASRVVLMLILLQGTCYYDSLHSCICFHWLECAIIIVI